MPFVEFAPAKINLALHVLGRRDDGYHELDCIVAFADVGDQLTFTQASESDLSIDGPFAAGLSTGPDNLVMKAVAALQGAMPLPPVHIHLTKNLPVASGIGGGSADAAAALRGLVRFAGKPLDHDQLHAIALSLGADVPVCLKGKHCRMQGIGETLTMIDELPWKAIVLANPLQPCSTADVFQHLGLARGQTFGTALNVSMPESWRNDLTLPALKALPVVEQVLEALSENKTLCSVGMSGSGATCFGLTKSLEEAEKVSVALRKAFPQWWVVASKLLT